MIEEAEVFSFHCVYMVGLGSSCALEWPKGSTLALLQGSTSSQLTH